MKKRISFLRWTMFSVVVLICTAICYPLIARVEKNQTVEGKVVKLTREDSGKEISLKVGEGIEIELSAPGSTGYLWYLDPVEEEYLELIGEESRVSSGKGLTGAPLIRIWKLKARKEGETMINMFLYRVWEGKGKALDTFHIKIKIS